MGCGVKLGVGAAVALALAYVWLIRNDIVAALWCFGWSLAIFEIVYNTYIVEALYDWGGLLFQGEELFSDLDQASDYTWQSSALAFLEGSHPVLGAHSVVGLLPPAVASEIVGLIKPRLRLLLAGSWGGIVQTWSFKRDDYSAFSAPETINTGNIVWSMLVVEDELVYTAGNDVAVCSLATGKPVRRLRGHTRAVNCLGRVGSTRDHCKVVSASADATIRVWDLRTGQCRRMMGVVGLCREINCLQVAGRAAVVGLRDASIEVWDLGPARRVRVLLGHADAVRCLHVRGALVVSGSLDQTVRVWDLTLGVCLQVFTSQPVLCVHLLASGSHVLAGSWDNDIRVLSVASGEATAALKGHRHWVTSLHALGPLVASGGDDTVRLWRVDTGDSLKPCGVLQLDGTVSCVLMLPG
eukprot:TRINITY_DN5736_c0_g1_i1.p1 TRINITY_DN5736_c0_g1~~TRINITY_DN5736_c0_g1_i1.p1  ORF type:complete len:435 (+),score=104.88 TRINITY_DN5736_c0_g1_i1:73-1305(+)